MDIIISASNRPDSLTLLLAKTYQKEAAAVGYEMELMDLQSLPNSFAFHFQEHEGSRKEGVQTLLQKVKAAEKLVFIAPEHNGSIPGILKLFIDACGWPHPMNGKKAALVGFSSGIFGNLRGMDHLSDILSYIQCVPMPFRVHIPQIEKHIDRETGLKSDEFRKQIQSQIEMLSKF